MFSQRNKNCSSIEYQGWLKFLGRSSNLFMDKPSKMLPAKSGRKRRPVPLAERAAVELGRLDYFLVNPGDPFENMVRAIIGAHIQILLMRPGRCAELGLTSEEAVELAAKAIESLAEKYGDRADQVIHQAHTMLQPMRETIEIDAESYATYLLSVPLARKTSKWTPRDFLVAAFFRRAADHHAGDANLLRGLAQEICSVVFDEMAGRAATKTDCQRFLSAHDDRFGPQRCQQVSELISRAEIKSAQVTYRSPLYEVSWDKSARRKFSSDLDLTLRICLACHALSRGGHPRPLSFIAEQLSRSLRSTRSQGWTVQDVESRLKAFRDQLVPEDEQPWPGFVAGWLARTDVEEYKRAFAAYWHGRTVRFCFKVPGTTGRNRRNRGMAQPSPRGLIVDSKPEAMRRVFELDWRPADGTSRLEWFAAGIDEWFRLAYDHLTREEGGAPERWPGW